MLKSKIYAERCLRDEAQALLDLIPLLDNQFEQVVDLIHRCTGHVVVTGVFLVFNFMMIFGFY